MKTLPLLLITLFSLVLPCLSQTVEQWLARADAAERKGQSQPAMDAYMEANKLSPRRPEILVKIAKQYGDLMTETKDGAARKKLGLQSLAYSQQALAADGESAEAHLSVAISRGKLAEFLGNRERVVASREIKMHADKALKLDPKSDYAHHMLGRWHQELAGMGMATRAVAKVIYGGLPRASYEEALGHFGKAKKLRADRLIHEIEYARTLAMLGRKAEAKAELAKCLAKPGRDKDDARAKERAKETLESL